MADDLTEIFRAPQIADQLGSSIFDNNGPSMSLIGIGLNSAGQVAAVLHHNGISGIQRAAYTYEAILEHMQGMDITPDNPSYAVLTNALEQIAQASCEQKVLREIRSVDTFKPLTDDEITPELEATLTKAKPEGFCNTF